MVRPGMTQVINMLILKRMGRLRQEKVRIPKQVGITPLKAQKRKKAVDDPSGKGLVESCYLHNLIPVQEIYKD